MTTARLMVDFVLFSHSPEIPDDFARQHMARVESKVDRRYIRGRRGGLYRIVKVEREGWSEPDRDPLTDSVTRIYKRRVFAVYEPPRKRRP